MTGRQQAIRDSLGQRVSSGLHLGLLRPGERLGSARQLAREAGADYRTVIAGLRSLHGDGLLEIRPRGGIYVGRPGSRGALGERDRIADRLAGLVADELAAGTSFLEMAGCLGSCVRTAGLRATCLECNEDQLDFLCRQLAGFGLQCSAVEVDALRSGVPAAVRAADLLVTTSFHLHEVRRYAALLGKACAVVTLDPRRRVEVAAMLAERPVMFIGTDPRWAAKARAIWAKVPGAERLRHLTIGQQSLAAIPPDAAVLLMPRARQLLAGSDLLERTLPARGLAAESSRQILSFVVRANLARGCAASVN